MMRRLTSAPKPCSRVRVYIVSRSSAAHAQAVADAVVAGEVGRRLGRRDQVVGGERVRRVRERDVVDRRRRARARASSVSLERREHAGLDALARAAPRARRGGCRAGRSRSAARPAPGRPSDVESHGSSPDHRAEQQRRVGHVARERARLVERGGEGDHPVARDRAVGRLEPDDPAQRGGLADRAAGVGADRPRRRAGGDRGGAAAGRAAGHARAVPRVEHRAVGGVLGRGAHRELVLVGLGRAAARRRRRAARPRSRCRAAGSPRGSASRPGSGCPRCRRGP